MMRWIVESSLKLRFLVLVIALALLSVGFIQLHAMPVDIFPEFAPPYVEIQTEALGLSAKEVESLITVPMEEILHGVSWVQTMRSDPGTDLMHARTLVQERLTQALGLPTKNVSKPPTMLLPPARQPGREASLVLRHGIAGSVPGAGPELVKE